MKTTYNLSGNRVLKVTQDEDFDSPRNWDNLTKMIFFGRHSHLGDKHNIDSSNYDGWEDNKKGVMREYDCAIIQPVYAYKHSGMTISTSPFSCNWDSGQLGWVIVTKEDIRKNWSIKNVTTKYKEKAQAILEGEIEVLDQYIRGDVYRFDIEDEDENFEDGCSGYYGDDIRTNGILDNLTEEDKNLVLTQI